MKKVFTGFFLSFASLYATTNIDVLKDKAIEGQSKAYANYSKYRVGAAVETSTGEVITGCNIENASYGITNCAERTAIFKAVADGHRKFNAIVIVTRDGGLPCGACRQVLNEFSPEMRVICINEKKETLYDAALSNLLPNAFGPQNLN